MSITAEKLNQLWDRATFPFYRRVEKEVVAEIQKFLNEDNKAVSFAMGMGTWSFYTKNGDSFDGTEYYMSAETNWEDRVRLTGEVPESLLDLIDEFVTICGTPNLDLISTGKKFLRLFPDAEFVVQGHDNGGYEVISTTHTTPYPIFTAPTYEECNEFVWGKNP